MYSRNSFGSYYPIDSSVHRLNPIIKLIDFLIIIFLVIFCNSLYINLFMLGLVIIMMLLSFVPLKFYMNTFWSLRYIYILVAFICASMRMNMNGYLTILTKIVVVVEYLNIISYTTSPSESAYGIEKFLACFNILYLPISGLAFKMNSMLRYVPLYMNVEYKTLKAQASRGIDYYHTNIFGRMYAVMSLYLNVHRLTRRKNREIALSRELKLFNLRRYRTNYRTNKVGFYDIFFTAFHILLILAYLKDKGVI